MRKLDLAIVLVTSMPCSGTIFAQADPISQEGDWIAMDFHFHSGEVMPELRVHYTTVGVPSGEPVVVLHGTSGSGAGMLTRSAAGEVFGPGQPGDATYHPARRDRAQEDRSKPSDVYGPNSRSMTMTNDQCAIPVGDREVRRSTCPVGAWFLNGRHRKVLETESARPAKDRTSTRLITRGLTNSDAGPLRCVPLATLNPRSAWVKTASTHDTRWPPPRCATSSLAAQSKQAPSADCPLPGHSPAYTRSCTFRHCCLGTKLGGEHVS